MQNNVLLPGQHQGSVLHRTAKGTYFAANPGDEPVPVFADRVKAPVRQTRREALRAARRKSRALQGRIAVVDCGDYHTTEIARTGRRYLYIFERGGLMRNVKIDYELRRKARVAAEATLQPYLPSVGVWDRPTMRSEDWESLGLQTTEEVEAKIKARLRGALPMDTFTPAPSKLRKAMEKAGIYQFRSWNDYAPKAKADMTLVSTDRLGRPDSGDLAALVRARRKRKVGLSRRGVLPGAYNEAMRMVESKRARFVCIFKAPDEVHEATGYRWQGFFLKLNGFPELNGKERADLILGVMHARETEFGTLTEYEARESHYSNLPRWTVTLVDKTAEYVDQAHIEHQVLAVDSDAAEKKASEAFPYAEVVKGSATPSDLEKDSYEEYFLSQHRKTAAVGAKWEREGYDGRLSDQSIVSDEDGNAFEIHLDSGAA